MTNFLFALVGVCVCVYKPCIFSTDFDKVGKNK